jgi:shikimate dehydrogenase
MLKAGVIGHPISHSKSPRIHGHWLAVYGIEGEYKAYDIAPEKLAEGVKKLVDEGLKGFNVTLPHKKNMMALCTSLSDEARSIGAVNTITISENGSLHGHNTDSFGFSENLNESIPDFEWTQKIATVVGSGGAAQAILQALYKNGCPEIRLTNRTREYAERAGAPYQAKIYNWDRRNEACHTADLIINTTSLGMDGQPALEIDLSGTSDEAIVYDIVYTPLYTRLLRDAQNKGMRTVTGIGMLLHQARPGFQSWFGTYPQVTEDMVKMLLQK